jgi:hypothetical protein
MFFTCVNYNDTSESVKIWDVMPRSVVRWYHQQVHIPKKADAFTHHHLQLHMPADSNPRLPQPVLGIELVGNDHMLTF